MERIEMIEILKDKTKVSHEEAEAALEKSDWDLLDAIIYLERQGKSENSETTTIITLDKDSYKEENEESHDEKKEESCDGFGKTLGKLFRFVGKIIKKGNVNYFVIKKQEEGPIKISLTISAILLLVAFAPVAVLLVLGLLCGYKYSIVGPNVNNKVNDIFGKASESAQNMKNDFKEGYKKA